MGRVALHTATGLKRRRRKELEPSRRLSETTGPQSRGAFRVVVPATEVTKCGAWCKQLAAFFTHGAPEPGTLPQRTGTAAHVTAGVDGAGSGLQGDGSPFTCYRERKLGRRTRYRDVSSAGALDRSRRGGRRRERGRRQSYGARCRTRRRKRTHGSRQKCRYDRERSCGCRCTAKPSRATQGVQSCRVCEPRRCPQPA